MPAMLRRLWALVLIVIQRAERPVPARAEPPARRSPPLDDDRFGYGQDLGPYLPIPGDREPPPAMMALMPKDLVPAAVDLEPEPVQQALPLPPVLLRLPPPKPPEPPRPREPTAPAPEPPALLFGPPAPPAEAAEPVPEPPRHASIPQSRMGRPADKWVKPKGADAVAKRASPKPRDPNRPKAKPPEVRPDSEEDQWGQYYFRDAILDQLDRYFIYLKRMKKGDPDAYALLRQTGIQVMPPNSVLAFDRWRDDGDEEKLTAWFRDHLPSFGAVSYGIDPENERVDTYTIIDAPEELMPEGSGDPKELGGYRHQISMISGSGKHVTLRDGTEQDAALLWSPKFLYFTKYAKGGAPSDVQKPKDGVVYAMTIYWDRLHNSSKQIDKRKGGSPQQYALNVRPDGSVHVLRQKLHKRVRIFGKRGGFSIPQKVWGWPSEQLNWAKNRHQSPEDYLCRCFIEAALMYEMGALGSLIRIEARRENMTATFGVDIKRTSYFFKDRDVVLNAGGGRASIFHVVRPHSRATKTGVTDVKMHFRGLREFDWAGHHISITVPGLDHLPIPEVDIGMVDSGMVKRGEKMLNTAKIGDMLNDAVKSGLGGWKPNDKSASKS
jgi:hypothetical protein